MENRWSFPRYLAITLALFGAAFFVSGPSPVAGGLERSKTGLDLAITEPALESPLSSDPHIKVELSYGRLPFYFIENRGQEDRRVKLYSRSGGQTLWFTREGAYFTFARGVDRRVVRKDSKGNAPLSEMRQPRLDNSKGAPPTVVRLTPMGMSKGRKIIPLEPQEARVNYFRGNDPKKWQTNIPTYGAVLYREAYKGIDLKFYGHRRQLEYDIIIKPGADPNQVKFKFVGVKSLEVTQEGDLALKLPNGEVLVQKKPFVYQEIAGTQMAREGRFKLHGDVAANVFSFKVAAYDKTAPLIIDPVLFYSTYLGGSGGDGARAIAVDASGNAYVTGRTNSTDFPTVNPLQDTNNDGGSDAFVTKLNAAGNALVYSTYLGGSGGDGARAIAVDASGNAYVTGVTLSTDFPTMN